MDKAASRIRLPTVCANSKAVDVVSNNHFLKQFSLAKLIHEEQRHGYSVVHCSIFHLLLPYHSLTSLSLIGEKGQSRVCINVRF